MVLELCNDASQQLKMFEHVPLDLYENIYKRYYKRCFNAGSISSREEITNPIPRIPFMITFDWT